MKFSLLSLPLLSALALASPLISRDDSTITPSKSLTFSSDGFAAPSTTTTFTVPAVDLLSASGVSFQSTAAGAATITFTSSRAFNVAHGSWLAEGNLLLRTKCAQDEGCWYLASNIIFDTRKMTAGAGVEKVESKSYAA
ncbi:hypothetical protein K461DRAFT_324026 [Myriangium duriaei CBS 260.36]|uniref:Uncharacterized protein n=1 Tax=Myriangium duriaei CBS 260.36 TaxID=1168546 RepID=A0A9P4IVI2_9PEZI|nr:hypothetical protein K461DRAFT_324026 [Myriangium duriaei CBS 260.36]